MALKTHLEESEIVQLVEAAPTLRDRLIIQFLFRVGCRVSELINLKVNDIDWDRGIALIPHLKKAALKKQCPACDKKIGKRNKFCPYCGADVTKILAPEGEEKMRLVRVDAGTLDIAREYVTNRESNSDRLIPLTRQMVYHIIRQAAEVMGFGGKVLIHPESGKRHFVSPHKLRDLFALTALERDSSITGQIHLQQQLGHKSFSTTTRYIKFSPEEATEWYDGIWEEDKSK